MQLRVPDRALIAVTAQYAHDDARAKAAMLDAAQHIIGRLPAS